MSRLTTGQLADAAAVNSQTLRYYERRGLLEEPRRSPGNYRLYDESDVVRVRFIKRAQRMGFSLEEVRELLDLSEDPSADCDEVRRRARLHLADVRRKIRDLTAIQDRLESLIEGCPVGGSLSDCPIFDAFLD